MLLWFKLCLVASLVPKALNYMLEAASSALGTPTWSAEVPPVNKACFPQSTARGNQKGNQCTWTAEPGNFWWITPVCTQTKPLGARWMPRIKDHLNSYENKFSNINLSFMAVIFPTVCLPEFHPSLWGRCYSSETLHYSSPAFEPPEIARGQQTIQRHECPCKASRNKSGRDKNELSGDTDTYVFQVYVCW